MYRSPRLPAHRQSSRQSLRLSAPHSGKQRTKRTAAILILSAAALILVVTVIVFGMRKPVDTHKKTASPSSSSQQAIATGDKETAQNQGFNKQQHSTTAPASLWVIVNKQHSLAPKTYTPENLVVPDIPLRANITGNEKYVRADMAKALEKMVADAKTAGIIFNLQSGYRSYEFQVTLYNSYVKSQGQAVADRQSARPGYSEHQTGLAADLGGVTQPGCDVEQCYATTPEGKWLAANAYKYGFIIRYTADKESVTGYIYEPWHIRYVGAELSAKMHSDSIETLEEFFDITGGTAY